MASKKFYAVQKGRIPGVYTDWATCKAQTDGFTGAVFKSFPTKEEALSFVQNSSGYQAKPSTSKISTSTTGLPPVDTECIAYIDGSYNKALNLCGAGGVLLEAKTEKILWKFYADLSNEEEMRNVTGEIRASLMAVEEAIERGFSSITIAYDYQGVESWATGAWKANKTGTQEYQKQMSQFGKQITIKFLKIKAHSGDKYNDMADELAKRGCGQ